MLDVRRLRVLREVARRGSFSAAAEVLGYTQPAVSRQVALLEQETGTTLLERRPGGVRLTDAGELLVGHADAVLARLQDAEDELGALLGLRSGRLRMSTLTSAAATIVPLAIAEFRQRLPAVELSVAMIDPVGLVPSLRAGELDLALCNDPSLGDVPDVEALHLFDEPMLMALPRDHALAGRKRVRLTDLAQERWMLGTTTGCPDAGRFIRACHTAGFDPQIAFHNDDYTAILGFVGAGVGVAPVPEMVVRTPPPNVSVCSLGRDTITRPIVAAMPAGYRPGAAQAMLDVLQEVSESWTAMRRPELAAA
ncbi:MAG TPA: LysR family transcriptional regulator [Solirubrobacteraceae bacterium]|nr:LysR family transcriptional regulator [Solirubrobacteraceae bacterium]